MEIIGRLPDGPLFEGEIPVTVNFDKHHPVGHATAEVVDGEVLIHIKLEGEDGKHLIGMMIDDLSVREAAFVSMPGLTWGGLPKMKKEQ